MKKLLLTTLTVLLFLPVLAIADTVSTMHIDENQAFSAKNLKVIQKAGNTFFTRAVWGLMYVRVTVMATSGTAVLRKYGEQATAADVEEGDYLNVDGKLMSGEGAIMVTPFAVQDISLEKAGKNFSGTITALLPDVRAFALKTKSDVKNITVLGTTTITKGARTIAYSELSVKDKILSAKGEYDHTTGTLKADTIEVYQDPSVFLPRNFEGTLKAIGDGTLTASIGSSDYRVSVGNATFLSSSKKATQLSRFSVGDKVRVYGSITKTDLSAINAEVVRNLAF